MNESRSISRRGFISGIFAAAILASRAPGLAPDPGPIDYIVTNGSHWVFCDPKDGMKCIEKPGDVMKWTIPRWFRHVCVGEDGRCLAACSENAKDPRKADRPGVVVITFFKDGKQVREVTAGELLGDLDRFVDDGEVFRWGAMEGFMHKRVLNVRLANGETVVFDADTGTIADRKVIK